MIIKNDQVFAGALAANAVLQVTDLRIPQALLVLLVRFVSKISDPEYSLAGHWTLLYAKFKKFIFVLVIPAIPDKFVVYVFQYVRSICTAIPSEEKGMFALVYLIGKPFLQAYGRR